MAAIHGRYRSGSHFFSASECVCLSRTHSQSYVLSLSVSDKSQRSPSLAPLLFTYTGFQSALWRIFDYEDIQGNLIVLGNDAQLVRCIELRYG